MTTRRSPRAARLAGLFLPDPAATTPPVVLRKGTVSLATAVAPAVDLILDGVGLANVAYLRPRTSYTDGARCLVAVVGGQLVILGQITGGS